MHVTIFIILFRFRINFKKSEHLFIYIYMCVTCIDKFAFPCLKLILFYLTVSYVCIYHNIWIFEPQGFVKDVGMVTFLLVYILGIIKITS